MNNEHFLYAKQLSDIGDKITEVSNKLLSVENINVGKKDFQELKRRRDIFLDAIEGYKFCKLWLIGITPPKVVVKEHERMRDAVQMFIDGTEMQYKSIDIEHMTFDSELAMKGVLIQNQGKEMVVKIANQISLLL